MKDIDGKKVSNYLLDKLNIFLKEKNSCPTLVDITIGDSSSGLIYSKMKKKTIEELTPIKVECVYFEKITLEELIEFINKLNNDNNVNGIMIQLPLPDYLKEYERKILDKIKVEKDVDGLTSYNIDKNHFIPCTALGILSLLKSYKVDLVDKKIAIINRSNIVGKPLYKLLLKENANPIICHSQTKDLISVTKECDIIVAALNKEKYIDSKYVKDNAIVIDVGVHKEPNGKIVGDVNYDEVYDKVSLITPPTNAVGPMTICMLAYNTAKTIYKEEIDTLLNISVKEIGDLNE